MYFSSFVSLEQSSVWLLINRIDKRVLITYSRVTSFGVSDLLRKIYYRDRRLNKTLIQDYLDNKLEFEVVEYTQKIHKGDLFIDVLKQQYMKQYIDNGYSLYNQRTAIKLFVSIVAIKQTSLSFDEEEYKVVALLKPKQLTADLSKHLIIGMFDTFYEAKAWCKDYYGSYEHENAKQLIIANNDNTKKFFNNPVVQDRALLESYKKVFQLKQ